MICSPASWNDGFARVEAGDSPALFMPMSRSCAPHRWRTAQTYDKGIHRQVPLLPAGWVAWAVLSVRTSNTPQHKRETEDRHRDCCHAHTHRLRFVRRFQHFGGEKKLVFGSGEDDPAAQQDFAPTESCSRPVRRIAVANTAPSQVDEVNGNGREQDICDDIPPIYKMPIQDEVDDEGGITYTCRKGKPAEYLNHATSSHHPVQGSPAWAEAHGGVAAPWQRLNEQDDAR
jgi:hypothetical protein